MPVVGLRQHWGGSSLGSWVASLADNLWLRPKCRRATAAMPFALAHSALRSCRRRTQWLGGLGVTIAIVSFDRVTTPLTLHVGVSTVLWRPRCERGRLIIRVAVLAVRTSFQCWIWHRDAAGKPVRQQLNGHPRTVPWAPTRRSQSEWLFFRLGLAWDEWLRRSMFLATTKDGVVPRSVLPTVVLPTKPTSRVSPATLEIPGGTLIKGAADHVFLMEVGAAGTLTSRHLSGDGSSGGKFGKSRRR